MTNPGGMAIVRTRVTREQAGDPPEPGMVFNEDLQAWIPFGQQLAIDRYDREQDPSYQLAQYDKRRQAILHFVAEKLVEAEYDEKGYIIEDRLGDYYVVPGSKKKALSKRGGEKLADLFRLRRGSTRVTGEQVAADHVGVRVACDIVDSYGRAAGSHEAACSTAEKGFRSPKARQKYGAQGHYDAKRQWVETAPPDYRAAYNDVVARAGKRAFVGAVIVACAADEIFAIAGEEDGKEEEAQQTQEQAQAPASAPAPQQASGPLMRVGHNRGEPLGNIPTDDLTGALKWCRGRDPQKFADAITEMEEELEARRQADASA